MPDAATALLLRGVEKNYGALRPLRVRDLRIAAGGCTTLVGLDLPAAETFVNLVTGAVLPEQGEVVTFGQSTAAIADSDVWLTFVEQFGFVSDRIAMLDMMTVAQNLAIPFGLEVDPIPGDVIVRVRALATEVGIAQADLSARVGDAAPGIRARVRLGRALALDPLVVVMEHPTATLEPADMRPYAAALCRIWQHRSLTMVALSMDEAFGKALGGRLLIWQPNTGEFTERRSWFRRLAGRP